MDDLLLPVPSWPAPAPSPSPLSLPAPPPPSPNDESSQVSPDARSDPHPTPVDEITALRAPTANQNHNECGQRCCERRRPMTRRVRAVLHQYMKENDGDDGSGTGTGTGFDHHHGKGKEDDGGVDKDEDRVHPRLDPRLDRDVDREVDREVDPFAYFLSTTEMRAMIDHVRSLNARLSAKKAWLEGLEVHFSLCLGRLITSWEEEEVEKETAEGEEEEEEEGEREGEGARAWEDEGDEKEKEAARGPKVAEGGGREGHVPLPERGRWIRQLHADMAREIELRVRCLELTYLARLHQHALRRFSPTSE